MEVNVEGFAEALHFLADLNLSKPELFLIFLVVLIFARLPTLLAHRREMHALKERFRLDHVKLQSSIETERAKRSSKRGREVRK
jgi:hypothetical protein